MQIRLTKRQKQALETKELLFRTAVELFNEKGYDHVTVEEITQTAGVAKGSFYTYFRSKSDIVIEEFRNIDDYYREITPRVRRYRTGMRRLTAFTHDQLEYVRDIVGIKLLKLMYANNIMVPDSEGFLIDTKRYLHEIVEEIIEFGQERGEFRTDVDAGALSLYFNRGMRSMFLDWAISDNGFDLVDEGMAFCSTILCPSMAASASGPLK